MRKRDAVLCSRVMPGSGVATSVGTGALVGEVGPGVASVRTGLLCVVMGPSVVRGDTNIPGLVGKSFSASVCRVAWLAAGAAVPAVGLGVGLSGSEA